MQKEKTDLQDKNPVTNPWQDWFDSLKNFSDDFMEERDQQTEQERESFDEIGTAKQHFANKLEKANTLLAQSKLLD